jgi:hypothetical protein
VAALVANASGDLKLERRLRHALSSDAHDLGDEFVGYVQFIRRLAIHEHEQPPTQLLIDGVVPIARDRLPRLRDVRLRKSQQYAAQRASLLACLA